MLHHLDSTLRHLLLTRVPGITNDAQVRFQPPDEDWRSYVKTLTVGGNPVNAVNVYLVDVRENRQLRSNARERTTVNGDVHETPAPRRLDCHYLITTWSPADITPAIEPTLDEHALLYEVARVLSEHDPLTPAEVFDPAPPPVLLADETLPIALLPPEGFPKLAEFWGTMGDKHRLKPAVHLVVTVPILPKTFPSGPLVTTILTDSRVAQVVDSAEVFAAIGGVVRTGAPPVPVEGAWVELLTMGGERRQLSRTDGDGRFRFTCLSTGFGNYQLRASSVTLGPSPLLPIAIPSPTGEYDISL